MKSNFVLLWLIFAMTGCASAPRITLNQIPIYPNAIALAGGEQVKTSRSVVYVTEQGQALRRNFKLTGTHAEASYRIPRSNENSDTQRDAIKSWYFNQLDATGWRSNFATAGYTVYTNSTVQYLIVYVLTGETDKDDFDLILTLDE